MFFEEPRDNGWPAHMSITVASGEIHLLELLWIRHHANLRAIPRLPSADLPGRPSTGADFAEYELAWAEEWNKALKSSARIHTTNPELLKEQSELWELPHPVELARSVGVSLVGAHEWKRRLRNRTAVEDDISEEMHGAWSKGLRLIIELPLRGDYGRQYDDHVLLVSGALRASERKYATLLSSFRQNS